MFQSDVITLPRHSMIALCGPPAAGKSTLAKAVVERNGLMPTAVVSSDICRLAICDDPKAIGRDKARALHRDTFQLFALTIEMRMTMGVPVIADTVNLWPSEWLPNGGDRVGLLHLARRHGYYAALVVFDVSLETCLVQNRQREKSRQVDEEGIPYLRQRLDEALPLLPEEGWDQVVILRENRQAVLIDLI
ncbi:MAG: AAA family ATPase [Dehalococcoidia bacterium]|nr:AAA family ATPase [Dehalococcoidia bacterium]